MPFREPIRSHTTHLWNDRIECRKASSHLLIVLLGKRNFILWYLSRFDSGPLGKWIMVEISQYRGYTDYETNLQNKVSFSLWPISTPRRTSFRRESISHPIDRGICLWITFGLPSNLTSECILIYFHLVRSILLTIILNTFPLLSRWYVASLPSFSRQYFIDRFAWNFCPWTSWSTLFPFCTWIPPIRTRNIYASVCWVSWPQ